VAGLPAGCRCRGCAQVVSYIDVLEGRAVPGQRVAVVGAGGIGFDVAEYLTSGGGRGDAGSATSTSLNVDAFLRAWGIDKSLAARGGVDGVRAEHAPPARQVGSVGRRPLLHARCLRLCAATARPWPVACALSVAAPARPWPVGRRCLRGERPSVASALSVARQLCDGPARLPARLR
jgi:hypothetical protein